MHQHILWPLFILPSYFLKFVGCAEAGKTEVGEVKNMQDKNLSLELRMEKSRQKNHGSVQTHNQQCGRLLWVKKNSRK